MKRIILYSIACLCFSANSFAQGALIFNWGYGAMYTGGSLDLGGDRYYQVTREEGWIRAMSQTLQYRWYKYDRGFRTIRLTRMASGDVTSNNSSLGIEQGVKVRNSYTALQYDAAFMMFGKEIEDKFMPYLGGGYLVGFTNYSHTLGNKTTKESFFTFSVTFKLGFDIKINNKFAVNTEIHYREGILAWPYNIGAETGLLYKLY